MCKRKRDDTATEAEAFVAAAAPAVASEASALTRGLTLKGALYNHCILNGHKRVENRPFRIKPGWYALHTGVGKLAAEDAKRIHARMGGACLPDECSLPHGVIVGAVHFCGGLKHSDCAEDHWATGPICNVIDAYCALRRPVPHRGALSLWKIKPDALAEVQAQLASAPVHRNADVSSFFLRGRPSIA